MKRVGQSTVAVAALLFLLSVQVQTAHAATLSVNTTVDELNSDGDCSLREAIQAANTNAAVDACPAGDPGPTVDVVGFSVTGTITLGSTLPTVSEAVTIDGPGAGSLAISGGSTVRVLEVSGGATLNVVQVTVANGSAQEGGGILNFGTLTITNSTLSGNSATGTGFEGGGAIRNHGTVTVTSSSFSLNSAPTFGGGIFNSGTLTVTQGTLSGNSANQGGGIANGGTLTVTNSTFSGNSAAIQGGAVENHQSRVATVTNSTFSGNSASAGAGGGIANGGHLTITNGTFSGNDANFGGGINHFFGTLTVTHGSLSGNSAVSEGGGIYLGATANLQNTIIANSISGGNCSGAVPVDDGGNLQHPGTDCGATITSADPLLDPAGLQDNGGPTETITLQAGSPAINAALSVNCPATDQRGVARPQGAGCDIGAVEVFPGYPRPQGATPLRVALVPAYLACAMPNRIHGPPLAHASCAAPAKLSQYATVGTPDANGKPAGSVGSVRTAVLVGNPSTPADEADVALTASVTDVRNPGDLSDYAGELLVAVGMRITDKHNGPSLLEPATVVDTALSWPLQCVPTADPNVGTTCAASTTADALVPGTVDEGKRAIWAFKQVQVADGGEDGQAATTGDNTPFLKQGVFVP